MSKGGYIKLERGERKLNEVTAKRAAKMFDVSTSEVLGSETINEGSTRMDRREYEFLSGSLSKDATFRLLVAGTISVTEIDRLIIKLQLERQFLSNVDPAT
jgi:hypothetical protein